MTIFGRYIAARIIDEYMGGGWSERGFKFWRLTITWMVKEHD